MTTQSTFINASIKDQLVKSDSAPAKDVLDINKRFWSRIITGFWNYTENNSECKTSSYDGLL